MSYKNLLHFAKIRNATEAEVAGLPKDSGNGYYSYSYYALPYSGIIGDAEEKSIKNILFKRHYNYPFTTFGNIVSILTSKDMSDLTGTIIYSATYHHGD